MSMYDQLREEAEGHNMCDKLHFVERMEKLEKAISHVEKAFGCYGLDFGLKFKKNRRHGTARMRDF